ncbi:hypothetical protein OHA79_13165 [Streptomyces sp. NBC_00841]|uniref:hypothetical protein n=1 Tax=unclassified Streptomyces TaxID=2593676 RepID=UPI002258D040|nr:MULTISPECIES: hypothetical protein [unclassified Streptomyces]MCX4536044.1 hypothetical protein [Streptomyces sp. NBC_01669]WRZ98702.1 hypothetical protein OHA79_13165 [Streptomyces sp. NBC_00841]
MSGTESVDSTWKLSNEEGGALAGRWWKWALSAPDDRSPVKDTTGEHAAWNQPDDLWFLAGTYGGRVVRRCAIPSDRPVFGGFNRSSQHLDHGGVRWGDRQGGRRR